MLGNLAKNSFLLLKESLPKFRTAVGSSDHGIKGRFLSSLSDDTSPKTTGRGQQDLRQQRDNSNTVKVLYDGECSICMHEIRLLQNLARKRTVTFVDINSSHFTAEAFNGVTYEMAMKEMHVIGAEGKVYVQGDAIREMYRACGLGWLAAATQLPGIEAVCNRMYMKFAQYRLEKALDRCDSGTSCSVKLKHLRDKLRPQQE